MGNIKFITSDDSVVLIWAKNVVINFITLNETFFPNVWSCICVMIVKYTWHTLAGSFTNFVKSWKMTVKNVLTVCQYFARFLNVSELYFLSKKYALINRSDLQQVVCCQTWWRHQMETFSALLAISAGNSLVTGEFPAQRPVTQSFDVFFDRRPIKRLRKQSWGHHVH